MDHEDEVNLPEDSESEDEDFVPGNEHNENLSEEEDEGEPEGKAETKKPKKRNGKGKTAGTAKKRKSINADSEEDSDDDEDDQDYVLNERVTQNQELSDDVEDPEIVAAREKAEKERTDLLWNDFISSVEKSKTEKKGVKVEEKFVTKVYDFAGKKVEVKEKVKITSDDSETRSSTSSSISTTESSTSTSIDSKPSSSNGASNGDTNGINQAGSSNESKPPFPRKVRISFLSGDPAEIGLACDKKISAREGLANVLNALHARNKKLGTLDKTKLDWEKYKQDEGLKEELESHNRSKHGYIDKQEFLQRADLRQFELEKAARTKRRRNL